ncbi:zinc-ribbon domain protein [Methylocaldum marinum]|uniref:Zinc-ribbon domain protein n=1 Tax=Methylocaldum marinum TaxID=1432792 RepID=A0A250KMR7_9GAMM|nr:zinc-ribbon domain protein [Methylocaldum marinum]
MALIKCPICDAEISDQADGCPNCGGHEITAPIRKLGGKLQAVGTVLLAVSVLATVAGTWWGPALLFPGAAFFIVGRVL